MIQMIITPAMNNRLSIDRFVNMYDCVVASDFCIFEEHYFRERTIESEIDRDKIFLCFSYFSLKGIRLPN